MLASRVAGKPVAEYMLSVKRENMTNIPEYKYQAINPEFLPQILPANDGVYFKPLHCWDLPVLTDLWERIV